MNEIPKPIQKNKLLQFHQFQFRESLSKYISNVKQIWANLINFFSAWNYDFLLSSLRIEVN